MGRNTPVHADRRESLDVVGVVAVEDASVASGVLLTSWAEQSRQSGQGLFEARGFVALPHT